MTLQTKEESASTRLFEDDSTELSSRRTGMSFQRTRMSADRTLMSVIRTSLSLISFGFTISQFIGKLAENSEVIKGEAGRNFGLSLAIIGVIMLILGISYHARFMLELRKSRVSMVREGLIHGQSRFPPSMVLVTAVLLLLLGVIAITGMGFRWGPLS